MTTQTDLITRLVALRDLADEVASAGSLPATVSALDGAAVLELTKIATQIGHAAERIRLVATGVIGTRSTREAGQSGLAQSLGHRSAVSLIQQVTGGTRAEAVRQVRVGESLFETAPEPHAVPDAADPTAAPPPPRLWHEPLRSALMGGVLTSAQHDAIRRGLGEPPVGTSCAADQSSAADHSSTADGFPSLSASAVPSAAAVDAWALAAEQLANEAEHLTAEDLAKQARAIRDLLDPEGAEERFLARYEARSFRMWTDAGGLTHGKFVFDDESAAWLRTVIDSALRPRRGGPRFVDPTEKAAAKQLIEDPRTNDQLTHDLLIDVLKSGTIADAATVFGTKQAGVRIVQVVNRDEPRTSVTRFEDDGATLPGAVAAQQQCNTGSVEVTVDEHGNPLDIGREQRLYTPKQRIALAVRDGGCRWTGCDRPASYCEAHHIDEWAADKGRTDIDRGILLCRFHHMQLHHGKWKITRDGLGPFLLHTPPGRAPEKTPANSFQGTVPPKIRDGSAVELRPPLPLSYGWQRAKPPPKHFRTAA